MKILGDLYRGRDYQVDERCVAQRSKNEIIKQFKNNHQLADIDFSFQ